MTDEAKALVERLREYPCDYCGSDNAEAADLIETQAREIERLTLTVRKLQGNQAAREAFAQHSQETAMTSELKRCCAECSYWEANQQVPVPAPLEPTTRKFLWWTWLSKPDRWEETVRNIHRASIIAHNREGVCSRFPKDTATEKSYLCGEWVWKGNRHDQ